jgi:hypothetical protein
LVISCGEAEGVREVVQRGAHAVLGENQLQCPVRVGGPVDAVGTLAAGCVRRGLLLLLLLLLLL